MHTALCPVQIMIAEPKSRRKGIALEALSIMITYAAQHLVSSSTAHVSTLDCALLSVQGVTCSLPSGTEHPQICSKDWGFKCGIPKAFHGAGVCGERKERCLPRDHLRVVRGQQHGVLQTLDVSETKLLTWLLCTPE